MFNEIFNEVLKLGRVMTNFPQGYKLMENSDQIASIAEIIKGSCKGRLYYLDTFNDIKIALVRDVDQEMMNTAILVDTWFYCDGEPTHLMAFNYDVIDGSSPQWKWLMLTTIILSLTLSTIRSKAAMITDDRAMQSAPINIVNLYSTMIITIKILDIFGASDEDVLAHVRASYNDPIRDNITMDTINSIRRLGATDIGVTRLLDDSVIYYALTTESTAMAAMAPFKDLDITGVKNEETDDIVQLAQDVVPFKFVAGDKVYRALAYEGNLSDFIDDPDHYKILYIRTDDDGSGDWATFETKPVSVNNSGTIVISSRCDLSPIMVHDDPALTPNPVDYIVVTDDLFPDDINGLALKAELDEQYDLDEEPPTFEQYMEWVDTLEGEE